MIQTPEIEIEPLTERNPQPQSQEDIDQDLAAPGPPSDGHPRSLLRQNPRARLLALGAGLVLLGAAVLVWRYYAQWESTDDAQIDAYINPISARVAGYVIRVHADDNQYVKAGDVLVEIDPTDYSVAVERAQGEYANALANARAAGVNVPITSTSTSSQVASAEADVQNAQAGIAAAEKQYQAAQATLRQAEANSAKAHDDVDRYKQLVAKEEISQQQYEQALNTAKAASAAVEAAQAAGAATEQAVTQAHARLAQAKAQLRSAQTAPRQVSLIRSRAAAAEADVKTAKAKLDQAELNVRYTTIRAPVDGIVAKRSVQVGQNVQPGQQLLSVVQIDGVWVTANFKETQLKHMQPGQPAKIRVDAYSRDYEGRVLNIAGGSGAVFSLLPPENATGNYVKVVQRVPVKIVFEKGQDPQHLLRPGMSAQPEVKIQ